MAGWPSSRAELIAEQERLGRVRTEPWRRAGEILSGGCFVCFPRGPSGPGAAGDSGWAGAVLLRAGRLEAGASVTGAAGAAYEPGLLAAREGALLEAVVRELPELPDVLLVDATGRDHPRRAGLALHLGAVLAVPTVGVTHRPLSAQGEWPAEKAGAASPLLLEGEVVGYWLRTRSDTRPIAVHAAWQTDPDTAVQVVRAATLRARTPEPLRHARRLARLARAALG